MIEIRTTRNHFGELEVSASDGHYDGGLRFSMDEVHLRGAFASNPLPSELMPLLTAALAALIAENGDRAAITPKETPNA